MTDSLNCEGPEIVRHARLDEGGSGHGQDISVTSLDYAVVLRNTRLASFVRNTEVEESLFYFWTTITITQLDTPLADELGKSPFGGFPCFIRKGVGPLVRSSDVLYDQHVSGSIATDCPRIIGLSHVVTGYDVPPHLGFPSKGATTMRNLSDLAAHTRLAVRVCGLMSEKMLDGN